MAKIKELLKKNKGTILIYALLFVCFLVLAKACILEIMSPFSIAFAFALLLLKKNGVFVAFSYFVSNMIFNLTLDGLIVFASSTFSIVLLWLFFKILKKKINLASCLIMTAISQAGYVYFNVYSTEKIVICAVSIFVSLCFVYVFKIAFQAIFVRGVQSRFTSDETVCFSAFCIAFFCGISNMFSSFACVSVALVALLVLLCSRSFSKTVTLCLSALAGLGFAFDSGSLVFMAIFVCFAIVSCLLCENKRVFSGIMILVCDALFGLFFNAYVSYNIFSVIPLFVVVLIFLFVPNKIFLMVKNFSFSYEGSLLSEFLILGEREKVKNRLLMVNGLFSEMQNEYRNLSIGSAERSGACEMLSEDLMLKLCERCPNKNFCKENQKVKQSLEKLFLFGMEKQKVTILDASNLIAEKCVSLSSVIAEVNSSLKQYFEYEKTIKENDQGKIMISEQLGSTAQIFKELAKTSFEEQTIDKVRSTFVQDELSRRNVVINECVVLTNSFGVKKVVLVVRNKDALSPEIANGLKAIFKIDFSLEERKMSKFSGWTIASFVPSEKYKLAVGFASNAKDNASVSGDTSGMVKIDNNRYLFAISDGMGHGEKANKIATDTLNLVENFYKAGFSSETIVSSINKILLPRAEDSFVTLDAMIVDLSEGVADFVKVGATISVVKSKNQCKMIYCDSLPLGITGVSAPQVQSVVLKEQDIVVLASDGVVDSFDKVEDFVSFVNNSTIMNIQMLADDILEEAESRTKHPDDMTVIVLKISANHISA